MFERFTSTAREVVLRAQEEARSLRDGRIGTEHLLLALLDKRATTAYPVLRDLGVAPEAVRDAVQQRQSGLLSQADEAALAAIGIDLDAVLARISETFGPDALQALRRGQDSGRTTRGHIPLTRSARESLRHALGEAVSARDRRIDDGHVLLGLLASGGTAVALLAEHGADQQRVRAALERARRRSA